MQSRASVGEGRGAQGAISLKEQDPWPFQTTSFSETTCNLKKNFLLRKIESVQFKVIWPQERLLPSSAAALGIRGGDLAGGDQDSGSSGWPRRKATWASTFLEKGQWGRG